MKRFQQSVYRVLSNEFYPTMVCSTKELFHLCSLVENNESFRNTLEYIFLVLPIYLEKDGFDREPNDFTGLEQVVFKNNELNHFLDQLTEKIYEDFNTPDNLI